MWIFIWVMAAIWDTHLGNWGNHIKGKVVEHLPPSIYGTHFPCTFFSLSLEQEWNRKCVGELEGARSALAPLLLPYFFCSLFFQPGAYENIKENLGWSCCHSFLLGKTDVCYLEAKIWLLTVGGWWRSLKRLQLPYPSLVLSNIKTLA